MAHAEARLGSPASITTRLRPGPGIVTRAGVSLNSAEGADAFGGRTAPSGAAITIRSAVRR